jgi:hypothetical protein
MINKDLKFDSDGYPIMPKSAILKKMSLEAQRRSLIGEALEMLDTDHSGTFEYGEIKF